jgi:hypothetical protein
MLDTSKPAKVIAAIGMMRICVPPRLLNAHPIDQSITLNGSSTPWSWRMDLAHGLGGAYLARIEQNE